MLILQQLIKDDARKIAECNADLNEDYEIGEDGEGNELFEEGEENLEDERGG